VKQPWLVPRIKTILLEGIMEGSTMRKLAEALDGVGFVVKKIEEETFSSYDRPATGEKYTGEIIIKIRPAKDEEADLEKARARKLAEKALAEPAPAAANTAEVAF
jgi:hypothetical protein